MVRDGTAHDKGVRARISRVLDDVALNKLPRSLSMHVSTLFGEYPLGHLRMPYLVSEKATSLGLPRL